MFDIIKWFKSFTENKKMKYVTRYSAYTQIFEKAPYTDDNYLYTITTNYILLENGNGDRDVKIISDSYLPNESTKGTKIYASIVYPWLNGASLPNKSGGGAKKPKPLTSKKNITWINCYRR